MATPFPGKTYRFKCFGTSKRLNLYSSGTASNGMNVVLYTPDDTREQQWLYSNGRLYIKTNTAFCLDRFTGSAAPDNADIYTASSADANEQLIVFEEVSGYTNCVKIRLTHKVNDKYYYLTAYNTQNGTGSGKSKTSAGNVFWRTAITSDLQMWTFEEVASPSGKYVWPTESHTITNQYAAGSHLGIDIGPLQDRVRGDEIYAFMDGTVSRVATPVDNANEGYTVRIHHKNPLSNGYERIRTQYMHMMGTPLVSAGQRVTAGTLLGYMGNSGNVKPAPNPNDPSDGSGTHLHFEVRGGTSEEFKDGGQSNYNTGTVLDPNPYLNLT